MGIELYLSSMFVDLEDVALLSAIVVDMYVHIAPALIRARARVLINVHLHLQTGSKRYIRNIEVVKLNSEIVANELT